MSAPRHDRALEGRIALVIGGAGGMGLASAKALAAQGATLVIADRDGSAAAGAAAQLGGDASSCEVDVSSLAQLRGLFDHIGERHGRLHILFSNAGTTGPNGFDITEEQFDHTFDINLKAHFFATNYAAPLMRRCSPHASIIYMSSAAGLRAGGRSPLYTISKSSILMMARAFARHLGPDGIRVNALCPGHIDTPFPRRWMGVGEDDYQAAKERSGKTYPLGRIGEADDIADVVVFLASDASRFMTGLAIPVDGGLTA